MIKRQYSGPVGFRSRPTVVPRMTDSAYSCDSPTVTRSYLGAMVSGRAVRYHPRLRRVIGVRAISFGMEWNSIVHRR